MAVPTPAQPLARARLFGIDIVNARGDAVIRDLLSPGRRRAHFVNAHCVNVAAGDPAYRRALATAAAVLPDGAGIELAFRLAGMRMEENLNGTDFVPRLLEAAARQGRSVFLLGGAPGVAQRAAQALRRRIPALEIAGVRDGFAGLADPEAAIAAVNASGADVVLVALGVPLQDVWLADHADRLDAALTIGVGALFDFLAGSVSRAPARLRRLRGEWLWRLAQEPRRLAARYLLGNPRFVLRALGETDGYLLAKRATDIALAGGALALLSPLLAGIALAVRLDSPGPVLFRQTRVGQGGRPFTMFKFRSMVIDAEARRAGLLAASDRAGVCFKARRDPRVTRVGAVLRRLSLDEAPQLLNVLRGEMSVVGPRPALPSEVASYPPRALGRLEVKPGLTGVWQVAGRAEIGFDKMVDMDLAYARRRSILLDLLLFAMTFRAVFSGRGAY